MLLSARNCLRLCPLHGGVRECGAVVAEHNAIWRCMRRWVGGTWCEHERQSSHFACSVQLRPSGNAKANEHACALVGSVSWCLHASVDCHGAWCRDRRLHLCVHPCVHSLTSVPARHRYRHIDCACDYGNEKEVGDGIRIAISEGVCSRKDLWVTSKLWCTCVKPNSLTLFVHSDTCVHCALRCSHSLPKFGKTQAMAHARLWISS